MAKKSILSPVKRFAKKLLKPEPKYVFQPAHTVISDYSEFSGLPIAEIEKRINSYKKLTSKEWKNVPGEDFAAKAETFYSASEYYICDILTANLSKQTVIDSKNSFSPKILESIRNHPGKKFLEFGGGTGVFCEIVHGFGKDVTYLDLPTRQFEFAEWRYKKYGLPIRMLQTVPNRLELDGKYDIIYTDAVMEHLVDPHTPAKEMADHLAPRGILVMLVDLTGEEPDMPMHKDVDIVALHDVLAKAGLRNIHGLHTFCSIWEKP
jgi:2-polyprenyl-3-methyl-5-hydroxy-6-metoxy-1,4-benzoquinol methylase